MCESFDFLQKTYPHRSTAQDTILQTRTFYGKEKKSLAYVIAIMNMILHGIEIPNIVHTNRLTENLADIQDKDRFDVVLANPPFGKERKEVQQNFPIRTAAPVERLVGRDAGVFTHGRAAISSHLGATAL